MESTESSSPIVTRAVSAALRNQYSDSYHFSAWQKVGLRMMGFLPKFVAETIIPRIQAPGAIHPEDARKIDINDLIINRLRDYRDFHEPFPVITIGVAQGGTTAHLATALGGPFLPQAFVMTIKGGSDDGNVQRYLNQSLETALQLADNDRSIVTIQHYDPIHDGWLTRHVNHLRLKIIELPEAYCDFLRKKLIMGGEIVYLEGGASWLRYQLGPRSYFQVGGWGAISAEEFLSPGKEIVDYARKEGLKTYDWHLENYPLVRGPESEWGSEPGLGEAIEKFCQREGYKFTKLFAPQPDDFSVLAFRAVEELARKSGIEPTGVIIEMFSQFDATVVQRSGLIPLWLIFNTTDSLNFLSQMTHHFPKGKPVFFSPLSTFSETPDLVPFSEWERILNGFQWRNIGARKSHYPADTKAVVDWNNTLREWCEKNPNPIKSTLSGNDLKQLLDAILQQKR